MKNELDLLSHLEALPEPRHLFILPDWADPQALDRLIREGYLTCQHLQRSEAGAINVIMGIKLTEKATGLLRPSPHWKQLAIKGSLAGAGFTVMSLLILYLG